MCGNLCRGLVSPRGRLATVQLLPITLDSVFRALITLQELWRVFSETKTLYGTYPNAACYSHSIARRKRHTGNPADRS